MLTIKQEKIIILYRKLLRIWPFNFSFGFRDGKLGHNVHDIDTVAVKFLQLFVGARVDRTFPKPCEDYQTLILFNILFTDENREWTFVIGYDDELKIEINHF